MGLLAYIGRSSRPEIDVDIDEILRPYSSFGETGGAGARSAFRVGLPGGAVTELGVAELSRQELERFPELAKKETGPAFYYPGGAAERAQNLPERALPHYTDREELRSLMADRGFLFSDKIEIPHGGLTVPRAMIYQMNLEDEERDRLIMENARPGLAGKIAGLGGGLVGSLADPINFIPFAGGLNRAMNAGTTIFSRAGLQAIGRSAKIGVIEGAAGALASDIVGFPMANRWGAELGWKDYMADVAFGGVLGSAFSSLGTAFGPRKMAELNLDAHVKTLADDAAGRPTEVNPILEESVRAAEAEGVKVVPERPADPLDGGHIPIEVKPETMAELANRMEEIGLAPGLAAAAARFLSRGFARLISPTRIDPNAFLLDRMGLKRLGEEGPAGRAFDQAMRPAGEATPAEFARRVSSSPIKPKEKTYFEMKPQNGPLADVSVRLPEDIIRHKDKRHPNMTDEDMDRLPGVLESLEAVLPKTPKARYDGIPFFGKAEVGGQHYVVIGESVTANKTIITTYFKDTKAGVDNWLKQQGDEKKAVGALADLWLSQAPKKGDVFPGQPSGENISRGDEKIKDSFEQAAARPGGEEGPRGRLEILADRAQAFVISFSKSADASTPVHEFAHFFREIYRLVSELPEEHIADLAAFKRLKDDWGQVETWLGRLNDEAVLRADYNKYLKGQFGNRNFNRLSPEEKIKALAAAKHEMFARGFETYLAEGRAPTEGLRGLFEQMKRWLTDIYKNIKNLDAPLNDEVRLFFDRLVAEDWELGQARMAEMEAEAAYEPASFEKAGPDGVETDARALAASAPEAMKRAERETPASRLTDMETEIKFLEAEAKARHERGELPEEIMDELAETGAAVEEAPRRREAWLEAAECVIEHLGDFV